MLCGAGAGAPCIGVRCVGMSRVGVRTLGRRPPCPGGPLAAGRAPLPPAGPAQFGAPPAALIATAPVAAARLVMARHVRRAVFPARLLREQAVRVVRLITVRVIKAVRARRDALVPLRRVLAGGLRLCQDARPRLVERGAAAARRTGAVTGTWLLLLVERPNALMVVEEGGEQLRFPRIDTEHHAGTAPGLLY
jgi:hypothetical protein